MKRPAVPDWLCAYDRADLTGDLMAGLVVTLLVLPQGLAFAAIAGLPPQLGLYASLLPLVAYALFGTSNVLSVGPVAIASLMTAAALAPVAAPGSAQYIAAAALLSVLSGAMLFAFGLMRLGILAQFLSHPVVSGFITGAAVLIIIGQLRTLFGLDVAGNTAIEVLAGMGAHIAEADPLTGIVGCVALVVLFAARRFVPRLLRVTGARAGTIDVLTRLVPLLLVLASAGLVALLGWEGRLAVIGELPPGLPALVVPEFSWSLVGALWLPALVIGLVGFVETVAVAQTYAHRGGGRIDPDAELRGLGAANIASGFSGGFPVAGSLSRTAINAEAGARTRLAGVFAAAMIAIVLVTAAGIFRTLPETVLAAIIIVIASGLVDIHTFRRTWRYDRVEGLALAGTAIGVVAAGVEAGIALGIAFSLAALVWRTSRPHIAVLGRVPGTEHFRNVTRYDVETASGILFLRVDENLFFGNAEPVERRIREELARRSGVRHVVLDMSSVSRVDATAQDMLTRLDVQLRRAGVSLHLSKVKGPVLDAFRRRDELLGGFEGRIHLTTWDAWRALASRDEDPGG